MTKFLGKEFYVDSSSRFIDEINIDASLNINKFITSDVSILGDIYTTGEVEVKSDVPKINLIDNDSPNNDALRLEIFNRELRLVPVVNESSQLTERFHYDISSGYWQFLGDSKHHNILVEDLQGISFLHNNSNDAANRLYQSAGNFATLRNYINEYTLQSLRSKAGDPTTDDREATLTLVRTDDAGNEEFIDLYNNGYSSVGAINHGIRIQKRGIGQFRPFKFEFSDGSIIREALRIDEEYDITIPNGDLIADGSILVSGMALYDPSIVLPTISEDYHIPHKQYVDTVLVNASTYNDETYVNESGDTMTGDLVVNTDISAGGIIYATNNFRSSSYHEHLIIGEDASGYNSYYNTVVGYSGGAGLTSSAYNCTMVGGEAGAYATGSDITAIGYDAGYESGGYFTAVGCSAGFRSGGYFTAVGNYAGSNSAGSNYISIGHRTGNTDGDNFIAIGYEVGRTPSNLNAGNYVAIGYDIDSMDNNEFILQMTNLNALPLIYGNFSTGLVEFSAGIAQYPSTNLPTISQDYHIPHKQYVDTNIENSGKYSETFDGTSGTSHTVLSSTHNLGTGPFHISVYDSSTLVYPNTTFNGAGDVTIEWESGSLSSNGLIFISG